MKKLFAILLSAVLLFSALPLAIFATETPYADTLPTLKNVLELISAYLKGTTDTADDLTDDGAVTLHDVLHMLKLVIKAGDLPASGAQLFDASSTGLFVQFYNYCPRSSNWRTVRGMFIIAPIRTPATL